MYILVECEERNLYVIYKSESEDEVVDQLRKRFFEKLSEYYDEEELKDMDIDCENMSIDTCEVYGDDFDLSADGWRAYLNLDCNYDWKIFKI